MMAEEAQNLAMEKVVGETRLSIMKRVRRTRGVERVRSGWMREWSMVGTRTMGVQRYDGRDRRAASVLRWPRELGVMMSLDICQYSTFFRKGGVFLGHTSS